MNWLVPSSQARTPHHLFKFRFSFGICRSVSQSHCFILFDTIYIRYIRLFCFSGDKNNKYFLKKPGRLQFHRCWSNSAPKKWEKTREIPGNVCVHSTAISSSHIHFLILFPLLLGVADGISFFGFFEYRFVFIFHFFSRALAAVVFPLINIKLTQQPKVLKKKPNTKQSQSHLQLHSMLTGRYIFISFPRFLESLRS